MRLLVVNYHYFREHKPGCGIYPLDQDEFEKQLYAISNHYEFITLQELLGFIENDYYPQKNCCLLTFDDGLKEQMNIYDILIKKGIGGVFFVCTDPIKNRSVLDVHKLQYIRSVLKDENIYLFLEKLHGISRASFSDKILRTQYRYDSMLSRKIKYFINFILSKNESKNAVNTLFGQLVTDEDAFSKDFYMDSEDIMCLYKHCMLGTHCTSHKPLATLTETGISDDILRSLEYLKAKTKNDIFAISYPYGGPSAVSEKVTEASAACGLKIGFTMRRGVNTVSKNNLMSLCRVDTNDAPGGKYDNGEFSF